MGPFCPAAFTHTEVFRSLANTLVPPVVPRLAESGRCDRGSADPIFPFPHYSVLRIPSSSSPFQLTAFPPYRALPASVLDFLLSHGTRILPISDLFPHPHFVLFRGFRDIFLHGICLRMSRPRFSRSWNLWYLLWACDLLLFPPTSLRSDVFFAPQEAPCSPAALSPSIRNRRGLWISSDLVLARGTPHDCHFF